MNLEIGELISGTGFALFGKASFSRKKCSMVDF